MTGARIPGLDCWRAMLVLGGLFVHASYQLPRVPLFDLIEGASLTFRMGAFFAISGFLAAIVMERRGARRWLAERAVQIGVPAIVGLVTLSPLVLLLVATAPGAPGRVPLSHEWHHLWFLYALLVYAPAAVALDRWDRRAGIAARVDGWSGSAQGARIVLWLTATAAAILTGAVPVAMRAFMPHWALTPFANVQMIAGYLPMFVLGFAVGRCPRLRHHYAAGSVFAGVVFVVAAGAFAIAHGWPSSEEWRADTRFLAAALCPPAAFALILRSSLAIRLIPAAFGRIADASYTIYILHFPLATAINTRFGAMLEPHLAYAVCVLAAGIASYLLHVVLIAPWPPLALLVNGRVPRDTGPSRMAHRER